MFRWVKKLKRGLPLSYPGIYPLPPHISLEQKKAAILDLIDKKHRAKVSLKKEILFRIGARLINWAVKFIYHSSRKKYVSIHPEAQALLDDPQKQFIIAMWHNRLFYTVYTLESRVAMKQHDVLAIISESEDGEFIARATEQWGAYVSRGSTSRGGSKAIKKILRFVKVHFHPLITPDGPRGPVYQMQEGLPALSRLTGLPVIAMCYDAKSKWVFNSWDKFIVPKPFSKTALSYSRPYYVTRDMPFEQASAELRELMMQQVKELEDVIKTL